MPSLTGVVSDNRQDIRDIDSRFVESSSDSKRDLAFSNNYIDVDVSAELYSRPTGSQVVAGHSDKSKGFGRGTFGDDKRKWELQTDTEASAQFTRSGRKAVAESLNGQNGSVTSGAIGDASDSAETTDTELSSEQSTVPVFASRSGSTVRAIGIYSSTDVHGDPTEFGLLDEENRLLCRFTVPSSGVSVPRTHEAKTVIFITFDGDGRGDSVIPDTGELALAESIRSDKTTVGPTAFKFGTGNDTFVETDDSLSSPEVSKEVTRRPGRDRIQSVTRVISQDLSGLSEPISEIGLFDSEGRLLWATLFSDIPADTPGFDASVTLVVN